MESIRNVLKGSLGRALEGLAEMDRLQAAWPVACGPALAARGEIVSFEAGVVTVRVAGPAWLDQMRSMGAVLERELERIAGVPVRGIHFKATTGKGAERA